jgi:hypothetical protein
MLTVRSKRDTLSGGLADVLPVIATRFGNCQTGWQAHGDYQIQDECLVEWIRQRDLEE